MGKLTEHFLIAFFDLLLLIMLFMNFLGWSSALSHGSFVQPLGYWGTHVVEGETRVYYFGFESLFSMADYLNVFMDDPYLSAFNFGSLMSYFDLLINDMVGNIPLFVKTMSDMLNAQYIDVWKLIGTFVYSLISPFLFVGHSLMIAGVFLVYIFGLLTCFFCAISGMFNVYLVNPLDYHDFISAVSSYSSELISSSSTWIPL